MSGLPRRALAGLLAPALLGVPAARATAWPDRPIRLIYPFTGGSPTEALARTVAEQARLALGVPIVFDSRPGAGGQIAAEALARSAPDGHTLGWVTTNILTVNPHLYPNLAYRTADFAPLTVTYRGPLVLAAGRGLPGGDLAGTVAEMRRRPGLAYATAGIGTSPHLLMEMFQAQTGVELAHLPFRGEQLILTELLAGRVPLFCGSLATLQPQLDSGAFRVLAISTSGRLPGAPDIPSFAELGMPSLTWRYWHGMVAPAGTPEPLLRRLHEVLHGVIRSAPVQARAMLDMQVEPTTREEFAALIARDLDAYGRLIRERGITLT
ncbi:Bug family tripartite tricarboxylate transporter substrate binding protein [Roseicella aquatilis]|uniref:Tripartite tricarboxylate transporter substrate binding protein n=1 Tax=Roseicella aquatilis TaxID=2527868 RepID=A0A4V2WM01_9PROT|nr:tripartite tricarboxylate transporter substrate binding protein [Roseicella aquatilis]TCZ64805.1 tripartite tricarboxylate transporter substrate binding protein [Roseicella aquatilis]